MANNETLGASFSIDVTQLKAGLAQANRLIRESESEFKAAAAGMDDWRESQEGLEARIKHLNSACDLQRKKVDALQGEYDRLIADGLDPTSAAAVKLRTDINKEKEALAKNESELKKQTQALEDMGDAAEDAADATREAGDAAEDAGDGFTVAKGAIAGFISNGLSALAGAAKDAISSVLGLADATKEYRRTMASLSESSKLAGYSAEETAQTYNHLYGVLGDAQAVATTTANLQAMGVEQGKLQQLTDGVIGAWAKYGDSIPIDGLAEAVNHTMQLGEVQGTLADVIEWGGGTVEAFNEKLAACSSETERADMIMQLLADQGLTNMGKAWQENNASIVESNKAQAENERIMAKWGEKVEPITNRVQQGFNKVVEKVLELVDGVDLDAFGEKIDGAFSWIVDTGIPSIIDGAKWIKDNIPTIATLIGGLTAASAAHTVALLAETAAQEGLTLAQFAGKKVQDALNASMLANPISLIIMGVSALVAGFIYLWKNCEGFRNFWINMWEGIKKAFGAVVNWIKENWDTLLLALVNPLGAVFKYCYEHFEGFRNFVDNVVAAVKKFFVDLWASITNGITAAWNWCVSLLSSVGRWIYDNVIAPVAKFFTDLWRGIVNAYHTVIDPWIEIFKRIAAIVDEKIVTPIKAFFSKLWADIVAGVTTAWDACVSVVQTVASWIYEKVISPVANFFTKLWADITTGVSNAIAAVKNVFAAVAGWVNEKVVQPVSNFFGKMWDGLKNGAVNAWQGVKDTFSKVASFFGDIFGKAWSKVKDVFSAGGKIFDGIKDGIVKAFKTVVNAIIRGINKVIKLPFQGLNGILDKLTNLSIVGVKPFEWLTWRAPVPQLPELATGGVVRKATAAIIGEDGAEAVVPLEKNTGWIKKLAAEIAAQQPQGVVVNQTNNYSQAHSRIELYKTKQATAAAVRLAMQGA